MSADIDALLRRQRLVVCVGPGGVGKTTVAASLALRAGALGRRALVLTVDPARRLADALGLHESARDAREHHVPTARGAPVFAAMLDTHAAYDALVRRIAPDAETRDRILSNRVYRAFSRTLARSHAYVAMERLHHAMHEQDGVGRPRFDLIVLDTPPTRSALEILDAPGSLARFADERVAPFLASAGARALRPSARLASRLLSVLAGTELSAQLTEFLAAFIPLREGFASRAAQMSEALVAPSTSFVLVTAALGPHVEDARYLREGLESRGVPLALTLFNRAAAGEGESAAWATEAALQALRSVGARGSAEDMRVALEEARSARVLVERERAATRAGAQAFLRGSSAPALFLPALEEEPTDVDALLGLIQSGRSAAVG